MYTSACILLLHLCLHLTSAPLHAATPPYQSDSPLVLRYTWSYSHSVSLCPESFKESDHHDAPPDTTASTEPPHPYDLLPYGSFLIYNIPKDVLDTLDQESKSDDDLTNISPHTQQTYIPCDDDLTCLSPQTQQAYIPCDDDLTCLSPQTQQTYIPCDDDLTNTPPQTQNPCIIFDDDLTNTPPQTQNPCITLHGDLQQYHAAFYIIKRDPPLFITHQLMYPANQRRVTDVIAISCPNNTTCGATVLVSGITKFDHPPHHTISLLEDALRRRDSAVLLAVYEELRQYMQNLGFINCLEQTVSSIAPLEWNTTEYLTEAFINNTSFNIPCNTTTPWMGIFQTRSLAQPKPLRGFAIQLSKNTQTHLSQELHSLKEHDGLPSNTAILEVMVKPYPQQQKGALPFIDVMFVSGSCLKFITNAEYTFDSENALRVHSGLPQFQCPLWCFFYNNFLVLLGGSRREVSLPSPTGPAKQEDLAMAFDSSITLPFNSRKQARLAYIKNIILDDIERFLGPPSKNSSSTHRTLPTNASDVITHKVYASEGIIITTSRGHNHLIPRNALTDGPWLGLLPAFDVPLRYVKFDRQQLWHLQEYCENPSGACQRPLYGTLLKIHGLPSST